MRKFYKSLSILLAFTMCVSLALPALAEELPETTPPAMEETIDNDNPVNTPETGEPEVISSDVQETPEEEASGQQPLVEDEPSAEEELPGSNTEAPSCGIGKHNWEYETTTEPDCTNEGWKILRCTRCGEDFGLGVPVVIPRLGHDWEFVSCAKKLDGALCTASHQDNMECARCGLQEERLNSAGHSHHFVITGDEVDLGSIGENYDTNTHHTVKCTNCMAVEIRKHSFAPATCTEPETCACDKVKLNSEALGHDFSEEWTTDDTNHWHVCTRNGCAEIQPGSEAEHTWDDGEVTKEPTATTEGEKTYTCTVCGHKKVEKLAKLPAGPNLSITKEVRSVKAPDGNIRPFSKPYLAYPGDTIEYGITVKNNGTNKAENVVIVDKLDADNLEFVSATGTSGGKWPEEPSDGRYVLNWDTYQSAPYNLTIIAKVKDGATGTIKNTATVECEGMTGEKPSDSVEVNVKIDEPIATYYTVTFDANGGSAVPSQSVEEGKTATRPENPTRSGYTFNGWRLDGAASDYDFATPVNGDITLTAQWTQNSTGGGNGGGGGGGTTRYTLTVRYEFEDGSQAAPTHTQRLERGDAYSVDSPEIEGYTPDQAVVSGAMTGRNVNVTVIYSADVVDVPDENPPLIDMPDIDIPDENSPLIDEPGIDIPDEEPPLVDLPDTEPPLAELPDVEPSLDGTPKTGDSGKTVLWAALCGISLLGIVFLGKKREDKEA